MKERKKDAEVKTTQQEKGDALSLEHIHPPCAGRG
jgi:hypothetical protein